MKKILLTVIILGLMVPSAMASKNVTFQSLRVNKALVTLYNLTSGVPVTSDPIKVNGNVGFSALLITENKAGGAGSVDVYAEYSLDKVTWFRPYVSDMAGTIASEGNIVTGLQNVTRYIVFTPRLSPWVRFVMSPTADSRVTVYAVHQEEL